MIETDLAGDGVLTVTLNRPEKRNALGVAAYAELANVFQNAQANDAVRVVRLQGNGASFCAGNDLAEFATAWPQPPGGPVERFLLALARFDRPVIAAVQGSAVGIGATMLQHCDLVFAARSAYLRFPFVDLGITVEGAASLLMPARIGHIRAADILLTGRRVPAEEALALGLVSAVVPEEELATLSTAAARDIAAKSPDAVRATKRLLRAGTLEPVCERFAVELDAINTLLAKRASE